MQPHTDNPPNSGGAFSSYLFRLERIAGFAILGGILIYHFIFALALN